MKLESKIKSKSPLTPLFQRGESVGAFFTTQFDTLPIAVGAAGSFATAVAFPPLKKGGRGDLLLASANQLVPNQLKHGFGFQKNLPIVEADDFQPQTLQVRRAHTIDRSARLGRMLRSVHFDDQSDRRQVEVGDVRADGFLSVTGNAVKLLAAKMEPEPMFGVGHFASKPAGEPLEWLVVFQHVPSRPSHGANAHASYTASNGRKTPQSRDGVFP